MKRLLSFAALLLLLSFVRCSDDNYGNPFDANTGEITINGITYDISPLGSKGGAWGWNGLNGHFFVSVVFEYDIIVHHEFSFTTSEAIKVGDDLVDKDLVYNHEVGYSFVTYSYLSGSAKVTKLRDNLDMDVSFNNLKMKSDTGEIYTFNGKVTVAFSQNL